MIRVRRQSIGEFPPMRMLSFSPGQRETTGAGVGRQLAPLKHQTLNCVVNTCAQTTLNLRSEEVVRSAVRVMRDRRGVCIQECLTPTRRGQRVWQYHDLPYTFAAIAARMTQRRSKRTQGPKPPEMPLEPKAPCLLGLGARGSELDLLGPGCVLENFNQSETPRPKLANLSPTLRRSCDTLQSPRSVSGVHVWRRTHAACPRAWSAVCDRAGSNVSARHAVALFGFETAVRRSDRLGPLRLSLRV